MEREQKHQTAWRSGKRLCRGIESPKVSFAMDAAQEGDGFEPSVPRQIRSHFRYSNPVFHDVLTVSRPGTGSSNPSPSQQRVACEPAFRSRVAGCKRRRSTDFFRSSDVFNGVAGARLPLGVSRFRAGAGHSRPRAYCRTATPCWPWAGSPASRSRVGRQRASEDSHNAQLDAFRSTGWGDLARRTAAGARGRETGL